MPPRPRHAAARLFAACAVLLIAAPTAAAAPSKRAALERSRPAAEQALKRVERLTSGLGVLTGRELTPALQELAVRFDALAPDDRREAGRLLARPTDGAADPDGYTLPEAIPYCLTNICVHYVTSGPDAPSLSSTDGDGIPDYVQDMAEDFEFAHAAETGPGPAGFAWQEPVSDGSLGEPGGSGTTGRTDVYLLELAGRGILGYAATDAGQAGATRYAYVVMDDDYTDLGVGSPTDARRSTAAHEYNHVLQYSYDVMGDAWMYESTATWMEDLVRNDLDEWAGFLSPPNGWVTTTEVPITLAQSPRMYGSAVWNHWLSERYGHEVVRGAWERSRTVTPTSFAPAAYESSIVADGGVGFSDEFARFATASAEWRAPGSGFSDGASFPDVERVGGLSVGDFPSTVELDHTTFALLDVSPSAAGAMKLTVTAPQDTVAGIALIGRTGGSPTAGTIATRFRLLPSGGNGSVELPSPGNYGRITAVVVNADPSQSGFGATDWNYTKDDASFDVELEALLSPSTPPANTALPGVTGTATDSGTLTVSDGAWSGSAPFTFTRQWRRCDAAGANCANIAGATGPSYNPGADDVSKRLRVLVTAANSAGSAQAESGPSAVIGPSAPANTALPEISGTTAEGQMLTASTGTWKGTPVITFAYEWRRCDAAGANCTPIAGATGATYTLAAADVGKRIRVAVSAQNGHGSPPPPAVSAPTTVVGGTAPLDQDPPTTAGEPRVGQMLTSAEGTWSGTLPIAFARQWLRCDGAGLNCNPIASATGDTYTLTAGDLGSTIRLRITATNPQGNREALSGARGPVVALSSTAAPAVTPTSGLRDGDTVNASAGTWAGQGPITVARQWLRCNAPGADGCVEIAGATGVSHVLTPADVGKRLRVRETGSNPHGSAAAQSAPTDAVAALQPSNATLPSVSGTAQAGQTLTGSDGTWNGTAPIALTRRWLRCDATGAACAAIASATGSTYVLDAADVGKTLRLEVSATNAGGGGVAQSAPTAVVAAAPGGGGTGGGGTGGDGTGGGGTGGGGTGGGGTGGGGTGGGGTDSIPLSANFTVGRSFRLATVRTRGLPFKIKCNTACSVRADLLVPRALARRLGLGSARQVTVGSGRGSLTGAGTKTVTVKLTRKAVAKLRQVRRLDATLRIVVSDSLGSPAAPLNVRVRLR